ncbi:ergot alkaloid biosynthesis protein [Roseibium porphyridii]|uniref:Ergot alkaloid biosynthesis protein n=1 Tax=Roseibium porphyridii TaxID=2866279 RepID=A0ABY8F0N6_9HYPH|nr:ergot alkaloid biosynthesis protein [Roseibium sp. KMA01]WFE88919.1 ergot alkaloid biosynthesis protein [Roseibium sp. KMA01]
MSAEYLVTGGTGKTGRRIVNRLQESGFTVRVGTRNPAVANHVLHDWENHDGFAAALDGVTGVYLLAPTDRADHLELMKPFIDQALALGVSRFVLLSASSLPSGGPMMGQVHDYLQKAAPEWCVLRPTWFMQNFSEQQHLKTIRGTNEIYSATADGRVPFIDVDDIAEAALAALTGKSAVNNDVVLTGPEALSYEDVARILSAETGREVRYVEQSEMQMINRFTSLGMPRNYAEILAGMDVSISQGCENRVTDDVKKLTGTQPRTFAQFAHLNRQSWI